MKTLCYKKLKYVIALSCIMFLTITAFSVNNLIVSGSVTATGSPDYTGITGTYTYVGIHNSHNYWSHTDGSYTYYIYYNGAPYNDWEIFPGLDNADCLSFASGTSPDPPIGVSWAFYGGYLSGAITVSDAGVAGPEVEIFGNGNDIVNGNLSPNFSYFTKFVSADISTGAPTRTFTISNLGTAELTISGISITGANAADFTVTTSPASSVAASNSTTFTVTFNPSTIGTKTATVTVTNNDSNEGSYAFGIDGYGYDPVNLVVTGITTPSAANTSYTHQGVLNDYEYWKSSNGYYLYTDGNNWFIDNNTVSTVADGVDFFSNCSFTPSILDATNWSGSPAAGTRGTGIPVIGTATATPNIIVKGNSTSIAINNATPSFTDNTKFGSVDVSSGSRTRTFTIENTGGAVLTLSGVTIGGTNAADFSITTSPSSSVAAYSSTTFVVTFDPATEGTKTATISIASNVVAKNPYLFYISGDAFSQNNLVVSGITTPAAANGTYTYKGILNEFQYWKHATLNYYIYNSIYSGTYYWYIDTDQSSTSAFDFLFAKNSEGIVPVGLSGWTVGTAVASVSGTPTIVYASPEINIKGNSISIVDGDATPYASDFTNFGNIPVCSATLVRTFTIENTGTGILYLSNPVISGTNASDFSVTTNPAGTVASSGSTTFQVTFNPSASGTRTATITINNNDNDEGIYDFAIQGTGTDITITPISQTNISCYGGSNGSISVNTPTGGTAPYTYNWTPGNPTGDGTTGITGLSAATWTCTATDANGCTGSQSFTITQPLAITLTAASQTNVSTYGGSNGTASINPPSGGAGGYTYDWTPGTPTGDGTISVTGLSAGTWTCLVTDLNGCSSSRYFSITSTAAITNVTASSIGSTSVTLGGNISADGGASITERGVVYSTTDNTPTIAEGATKVAIGSGTGTFSQSIGSLTPGITYYYNAYATNSAGISYGTAASFTTLPVAPTVTTLPVPKEQPI